MAYMSFYKTTFGTSCDNIRNVSRRLKNENPERTGFAHFRTLFEGTENIKRGEWFKIVTGNGGTNANTSTTYLLLRSIPI
jgi:predicted Zn-dependent peptidase